MSVEHTTQNQSSFFRPIQLGVMEAAKTVWELIGEEHAENFVVVGGEALLFHGSNIGTEDVYLAITAESMDKFCRLARNDPRLTEYPLNPWRHHTSGGFDVEIDFLDKLGGEYMLGIIQDHCRIQGVPVVTLADLALAKGYSWVQRENEKDLDRMRCVVTKMRSTGESFKWLEEDGMKLLKYIMRELECSEAVWKS